MLLPEKMASELPKLEQNALLELWEVDLSGLFSKRDPTQRGELFRFHNGLSQTKQNIIWQGNEYQAYPIKAEGFALSGSGPLLRASKIAKMSH